MATLASSYYDIIDHLKRTDSNNEIATVIELLAESNTILDDMLTVECNMGPAHRTTIRTGLPSVAFGQLYKGITQSKSTTQQVDETTGFLEGISTVDKRLLDISKDPAAVRLSEATAFLEAMNQEAASSLIYGNVSTEPEKFNGLAPRFSSLSAPNGGQIVDGGGTGSDNTSVWMVVWSESACHGIYPQGTSGGVSRTDHGEQRVVDASGNPYYAMEETFRWHMGLAVKDWRQVACIRNIDVSNLNAGSVDIYALFRKMFWKIRRMPTGRTATTRAAIYCNSNVCEALDADSTPTTGTTASYVRLRPTEVDGKEVMTYRGIPIRQVDAILNTEARVT